MRLLHPETMRIIVEEMTDYDFKNATVTRKTVLSHAWSECLKFLATRQNHPKMFLDDFTLGEYMFVVHQYGTSIGCNLNSEHVKKYEIVSAGFLEAIVFEESLILSEILRDFDRNYLFSDAISLYFKGVNIMPHIYGNKWRKYVPIENLNEIYRVVGKTLNKQ